MSKMARMVNSWLGLLLALLLAMPANGQVVNEDFKILANDGAAFDYFGYSIAIDNGILVVGANGDDDNGTSSGSAYLFNAHTGILIAKLLPDDGFDQDQFSLSSIAISNGIVAVGSYQDDDNGPNSGSAYLFEVSTGKQIAKLLPDDGAANDHFGYSIAIDNGIVAVASWQDHVNGISSGSAYLFNAFTGQQISMLVPNDGANNDRFGSSIAIDNGIVAVGSMNDDDNGTSSGSAYLFNAFNGQQIGKLIPADQGQGIRFGNSIDIDNNIVAVGAWWDNDNGARSGSAYIFDAITGNQLGKLLPKDGSTLDEFGHSIALQNGIVVVGTWQTDDNGENSGSAYIFDAESGLQIAKLLPTDGTADDRFSWDVDINNGIISIGAYRDGDNGDDSGSVYIFSNSLDCDQDGVLDLVEINNNPALDCNGNNILDSCEIADGSVADCNLNGVPDSCEIMDGTEFDCNGNGFLDSCEIADGSETDCNGNGNPDSCDILNGSEFDCNLNGIPDSCEIANGSESDCDLNGILDSCEIADGSVADCNLNGVPDSCEIMDGTEFDCNGNGFLDSCEIADGSETDCNGNGIPDSCEIADGSKTDCDGNGLLDSCDIQLDPALDCDANGAIDTCEIPGIVADTGLQGPIGFGQPLVLTVSNMPDASTAISVRVTLSGDFAAQTQVGLFSVNGQLLDVDLLPNGEPFFVGADLAFDCAPVPTIFEFAVPAELYNSGQINGEATFEIFAPTPGVSIEACPDGVSRIEIQYFYEDAPNDCNGNGTPDLCDLIIFGGDSADKNFNFIPDECEGIECLADLTGDGVLNFFDVSAFLQAFGNNDPIADFSGDGVFNFFDVSAFLTAFSAGCP